MATNGIFQSLDAVGGIYILSALAVACSGFNMGVVRVDE